MNNKITFSLFLSIIFLLCSQENLLQEMQNAIPIYKNSTILNMNSFPDKRMGIIQYEIYTTEVSEDELIEFYKNSLSTKGWDFVELNRWAGNGSVFSMTKEEWANLSVQIITKQMQSSGKIKVILNFTRV